MQSTRRGILGGLAFLAFTPAIARAGGQAPAILPPEELVFPTQLPTLALTSAGVEVTEFGRKEVQFFPVEGRPDRMSMRNIAWTFRQHKSVARLGGVMFSRNGSYVCDLDIANKGYSGASYVFMTGDTLTITEAQISRQLYLSL